MPSRPRMVCSAAVATALLMLGLSVPASADTGTATGSEQTYLVLYKQQAVQADADEPEILELL